jgi:hypothetical protein
MVCSCQLKNLENIFESIPISKVFKDCQCQIDGNLPVRFGPERWRFGLDGLMRVSQRVGWAER